MLSTSAFRRLVLIAAIIVVATPWPPASLDAAKPLADRVVIRRDTFGVPHMVAETEAAAGFGFGYAQAEDHAAEMARRFLAARVKPALLVAIAAQATPDEELVQARAVLEAWDARASATSRGAVLFQRFWETYRAEVRQPFAEPWDAARPAATPRGIANTDAALKHLADAVKWTRATYGAADVAWGDANRYRFGDLDLPGEGATGQLGAFRGQQFDTVPGQAGGVRVAGWAEPDRQLAGFGDAWVLLVHFTRPVQAFSVLAYGQTTDRASPHSRDQIRIFAGRDLRPAWFTDADIAAHLEREYRPR